VTELVEVYEPLISEKMLSDNDSVNFVTQAIKFLKNIENVIDLPLGKVPNNELFQFFSLLLDSIGLVCATQGTIQPLKLGDTTLIGRKRDLRGVYKGSDQQIRQNMCATLFQGWVRHTSPQYYISKDLRCMAPDGMSACDFQVKGNGFPPTLIECKRIHPSLDIKGREELIQHIVGKAHKWINLSLEQFSSSEKFLNDGKHLWHLILDISGYGKDRLTFFEDHAISGLLDTDEIQDVVKHLRRLKVNGLDEITICWSNIFYFERKPRVLAYNACPILIGPPREHRLNYNGWTIEFYPLGRRSGEYRHLCISSVARSRAWIKTSWLGCTDNLVIYGPPQDSVRSGI
jgi:hypothetical protein